MQLNWRRKIYQEGVEEPQTPELGGPEAAELWWR